MLLYPAIVATVALLIVVGLLTYVVPQVVQVFQQSRRALPFLTRAMLWMSDALHGILMFIDIAAAAFAVSIRAAYARDSTRAKWQALLLRLQVVGLLVQKGIDTARLASTLRSLLVAEARFCRR